MATYTIRIELHSATDSDYEQLHAGMNNQGFKRFVLCSDGNYYKLPTAEYDFQGENTTKEVFDKAEQAANSTSKKNWIVVTQSSGRTVKLDRV